MHAKAKSAGKVDELAGKNASNAMKVIRESVGNFQQHEHDEDPHDTIFHKNLKVSRNTNHALHHVDLTSSIKNQQLIRQKHTICARIEARKNQHQKFKLTYLA